MLGAATLLNDWLLAEDVEVTHHQINAWQITARTSGLTPEQRTKIRCRRRRTRTVAALGDSVMSSGLSGIVSPGRVILGGRQRIRRCVGWPGLVNDTELSALLAVGVVVCLIPAGCQNEGNGLWVFCSND